jgi:PIN domain nuclease of toxin-antitoxin system
MKRFLILAIGVSAFGLSLSSASACVLGQSACRNGILWTCQRCGSETCEIMTSSHCHKDGLPDQHVDNASRLDIAQARSTESALGFTPTEASPSQARR